MAKKLLTSKQRGARIRKGIAKAKAKKNKAKAGKSQWDKMTPAQRKAKIKALNDGRKKKRLNITSYVKQTYVVKNPVVIDLGNIKVHTTREEVLAKFG